jgi:hypothetical protein
MACFFAEAFTGAMCAPCSPAVAGVVVFALVIWVVVLFCASELEEIFIERLTVSLRNTERSKLLHNRFFDHARRHRLGRTRTPSVLPGSLAHVIAIAPTRFGCVGGDHRPPATLAVQQTGE